MDGARSGRPGAVVAAPGRRDRGPVTTGTPVPSVAPPGSAAGAEEPGWRRTGPGTALTNGTSVIRLRLRRGSTVPGVSGTRAATERTAAVTGQRVVTKSANWVALRHSTMSMTSP